MNKTKIHSMIMINTGEKNIKSRTGIFSRPPLRRWQASHVDIWQKVFQVEGLASKKSPDIKEKQGGAAS